MMRALVLGLAVAAAKVTLDVQIAELAKSDTLTLTGKEKLCLQLDESNIDITVDLIIEKSLQDYADV